MSWKRDILWGWKAGLFFAAFYSLFAGLIYLVTPDSAGSGPPMSYLKLITLYVVGGFFGGSVLGLLRPWTTHRTGSIALGVVVAIPIMLAFGLALSGGIDGVGADGLAGLVIGAAILGGVCGARQWDSNNSHRGK